jgi:hypothetical protein
VSDEDLIERYIDACARQIEADARAGAAHTFANINEANAYFDTLTPKGFWPRQEFFGDLFGSLSEAKATMDRIHRYFQTHPEASKLTTQELSARIGPAIEAFAAAVERQFPRGGLRL